MSYQKMDASTEQRLVACVKRVTGMVNDGSDPTDALTKVAAAANLTPPQVRRVGEAFNVSRSLANHKQASGEARCEGFPLAFPDKALAELWPQTAPTAGENWVRGQLSKAAGLTGPVKSDGLFGVNLIEKLAAAERAGRHPDAAPGLAKIDAGYAEDPNIAFARMQKTAAAKELAVRVAASDLGQAEIRRDQEMTKAANAVRTSLPSTRFDRIEAVLADHYGSGPGVKLAGLLFAASRAGDFGHGRADPAGFRRTINDFGLSPYVEIDRFVKAALDVHRCSAAVERLREATPDPFAGSGRPAGRPQSAGELLGIDKVAFLPGTRAMIDNQLQRMDVSDGPAYQQALAKALPQVEDPDTRDEVRRVRVQSMLSELMGSDPVISRYNPDEVLDAYNEVAKMAPEVADQKMMVTGVLRRALQQGGVDPFEAGQLTGTANQLRNNSQSTRKQDLEAMLADTGTANERLLPQQADTGNPANRLQRLLGLAPDTPYGGKGKTTDPQLQLKQWQAKLDAAKFKRENAVLGLRGNPETGVTTHQQRQDAAKTTYQAGQDKIRNDAQSAAAGQSAAEFEHRKQQDAARGELDKQRMTDQSGQAAADQANAADVLGLKKDEFAYRQQQDAASADRDRATVNLGVYNANKPYKLGPDFKPAANPWHLPDDASPGVTL